MHRQDDLWVCTYDAGERVRTELDRLNARERPFQIKPVPNPKPQNPYYPNTLETDDAAVFNFLSQQVSAQCRYELVESGFAPFTSEGGALPGLSWAARYFYDLIQANDRRADLITQAKAHLVTIADFLLSRQQGSGLSSSSTRANDAFFGGFLASGATTWVTNDAATCGLALLYAYRVHGTASYLQGARNAASYLRNVQAIGSNGTHFTSSDSAGTARLYTGGLASEVSTASGFYSNSLFYPSSLLALEFWNELKTTDGDQSVGTTGTPTGFDSACSQLLSASITDLRDCWSTGITDTTGTLINGLSSTTPREVFNAYPFVKANFPSTFGSGTWEFVDGDSDTGTQISSQNFCTALSSLYNYEGATSQVTTISDWLRTFTSNADFETPDDTSTYALYRTTTGEYDATLCPATLLTVRDAGGDYAAIAENGSSLYDWGAFGLLSRIWASRNKASFMTSRLYPLNTVQRYFDGTYNDGFSSDRVELRGLSGLTMQTGFLSNVAGQYPGVTPYTQATPAVTTPPDLGVGLVVWVKGDAGLVSSGGFAQSWADQSGYGQDFGVQAGFEPATGLATIDGVPCITLGQTIGGASAQMVRTGGIRNRNGVIMGYDVADSPGITVMAVFRPTETLFSVHGGPLFHRVGTAQPPFQALFDLEGAGSYPGTMWLWSGGWRDFAGSNQGPDAPSSSYDGVVTLGEWWSDEFPNINVAVNGVEQLLTPTAMPGTLSGIPATPLAFIGDVLPNGFGLAFAGDIAEILVWDHALDDDERNQARQYIAGRYSSLGFPVNTIAMVNDAVRAAQLGRAFREART